LYTKTQLCEREYKCAQHAAFDRKREAGEDGCTNRSPLGDPETETETERERERGKSDNRRWQPIRGARDSIIGHFFSGDRRWTNGEKKRKSGPGKGGARGEEGAGGRVAR